MRILVTGGTGFVGSHLVEALAARGERLRVLVRPERRQEVQTLMDRRDVEVVFGDLADRASLEAACEGIEVIYHTAAMVGLDMPDHLLESVNVAGLSRLVEACLRHKVKRFVHLSSSGFYRWDGIVNEESERIPTNAYEASKLAGEGILLEAYKLHGLPVVLIEPSFVYGPQARVGMKELVDWARMRWPLIDGGRHRVNMIYVSDVVDAMIRSSESEKAMGQRFLIGHDENPTYREILETVSKHLGVKPVIWSVPYGLARATVAAARKVMTGLGLEMRPFEEYLDYMARDGVLDVSKARQILDFHAHIDLEEGMRRTMASMDYAVRNPWNFLKWATSGSMR